MVLLLATAFVACTADEPPTRLRVTITGADGRVVVSGPACAMTFERDGDWGVRGRRYEVRIDPVRDGDATMRPTDLRQSVTVREGGITQARLRSRLDGWANAAMHAVAQLPDTRPSRVPEPAAQSGIDEIRTFSTALSTASGAPRKASRRRSPPGRTLWTRPRTDPL
jgi:hypothetical protein